MEANGIGIYGTADGMTIFAVRNAETFTIRINDGEDRQIGAIFNVSNVPRGLDMAQGFIRGYLAGQQAGRGDLFTDICKALNVDPAAYNVQRPPLREMDCGEHMIHELKDAQKD